MFLDVLASGGSKTSLLEFLEVLKSWRSSRVCKIRALGFVCPNQTTSTKNGTDGSSHLARILNLPNRYK